MNLTDDQLRTLRHMLGVDNCEHVREPKSWRNYAAVSPGNPKYLELAKAGAVELYGRQGTLDYYRCTPFGIVEGMRSARARTLPKPKRVYRAWLELRDPCPDLTFRQFLTHPYFADVRKNA